MILEAEQTDLGDPAPFSRFRQSSCPLQKAGRPFRHSLTCLTLFTLREVYRQHLYGIHINMIAVGAAEGRRPAELNDAEKVFLGDLERFRRDETGYQWIQGTKPQTLAYALNDSLLLRRGTEVVHVFRAPPISSCYTRRAWCCPNRPDGLATSNTTINSSDRARRKSASAGR